MSASYSCPNCSKTYETNYLFCPNCSSNLSLPQKVEYQEISYKEDIEDSYLRRYKRLEEQLGKLDWVEDQKKQQREIIKSLENNKIQAKLEVDSWTHKVEREKADLDNLKKMTWSSFKARLSGSHEEELKKEEEEYLEAVQQLDIAKKEVNKLNLRIENAKSDLKKISDEDAVKDEIKKTMTDLIFTATSGIKDEKEDKIEIEISELGKILDPYSVRKSKIQAAFSLLQMAAEYLRDASIRIDEDREKTVQKNALLIDALTKTDAADLRQTVKEASSFLNQAYEIMYQQFDDPTANLREDEEHKGLFQGQDLWERFMRNFMTELKKGFRNREETKKQLIKAVADINKLQSWVNSLLTDIKFKIDELMNQLRIKEQDLVKERTRIFKEYYAKSQLANSEIEEHEPEIQQISGFDQPIKELDSINNSEEDLEEEIDPEDLSDEGIRIKGIDKDKSGFNI